MERHKVTKWEVQDGGGPSEGPKAKVSVQLSWRLPWSRKRPFPHHNDFLTSETSRVTR